MIEIKKLNNISFNKACSMVQMMGYSELSFKVINGKDTFLSYDRPVAWYNEINGTLEYESIR